MPPSVAVVALALALLLLMTPIWTHLALDAAGGSIGGASRALVHELSDQTVHDLIFGGDFAVAAGGTRLYTQDELGHLRDVRLVLYLFLVMAAAGAALLAVALIRSRHDPRLWRSVARGGLLLIGGVVVLAVIGILAFGLAFELFHRLLFPGGNWAFPPDSNLIQLYPYAFWQLSAAAFGVLAVLGGAIAWLSGRRMAARLERG